MRRDTKDDENVSVFSGRERWRGAVQEFMPRTMGLGQNDKQTLKLATQALGLVGAKSN
jgi:hypothetical protein